MDVDFVWDLVLFTDLDPGHLLDITEILRLQGNEKYAQDEVTLIRQYVL